MNIKPPTLFGGFLFFDALSFDEKGSHSVQSRKLFEAE
jgi:hypothetical protein